MKKNVGDIHFNEPGLDSDMIGDVPLQQKLIAAPAYTLDGGDHFREIIFSCPQEVTVTIPADSSTTIEGMMVAVVRDGASLLTIGAAPGVTIVPDPDAALPLRLAYPGNAAVLTRKAPNRWRVSGDFLRAGV